MPARIEIPTGTTFGYWTVIGIDGNRRRANGRALAAYRVRCVCGQESSVDGRKLRSGRSQSCGCKTKYEIKSEGKLRSYRTWAGIISRCRENSGHKNYAGRGIFVCERWMSFIAFYNDMGDRPLGYTIERLDNYKGYEPSNCVWATPQRQSRNKRTSIKIEWEGETICLKDLCERLDRPYKITYSRLSRGVPLDIAILDRSDLATMGMLNRGGRLNRREKHRASC